VGTAIVGGVVVRQVSGQAQVIAQLGSVYQADKMTLPQIFSLGGVQRGAEVVSELVGTAQVVDVLIFVSDKGTFTLGRVGHFAAVGHAPGFDKQAVDGVVGNAVTKVVVRQQTRVLIGQNRVLGQMHAIAQFGMASKVGLDRAADFRIFSR